MTPTIDEPFSITGVTLRASKMFGEYALCRDEEIVVRVCDNQLFVKITTPGKALVGSRYQEGFAYPGAKASMLVGAEDLDDADRLAALVRATADALPAPTPKKAKKQQKTKPKPKTKLKKKPKTKSTAARSKAKRR